MIQYSDESLESRWYREHSTRIHMKRLREIKDRGSSIDPSPTRYYSVNRRKNRFKHNEMVRENIILYDKLTQISERKHYKGDFKGPKSLNISIRKKEADRIIQDNFDFVKRLTEKESIFSVKRLKEEFSLQEKYKSSISRRNLHERLKKITDTELKLPPISGIKGINFSRISEVAKIDLKISNKKEFGDKSAVQDPITKTISQSPQVLNISASSPKSGKTEKFGDQLTSAKDLPSIADRSSPEYNEEISKNYSVHSLEGDSKKAEKPNLENETNLNNFQARNEEILQNDSIYSLEDSKKVEEPIDFKDSNCPKPENEI